MNPTLRQSGIFIGLDLGTSGLKAVALDGLGQAVARASAAYPTASPEPGASEQNPQQWEAAAVSSVRDLITQLDTGITVRALGLSGMMPTLVLADTKLNPVAPAITWQDARAEPHGERLRNTTGPDELYRITGQWLDGRYLLPMYLGVLGRDPGLQNARYLLSAKDWLLARLTGEVATDPSTATGIGAYRLTDGAWHQAVLDTANQLARRQLPALPPVVASRSTFPLRGPQADTLGLPAELPVCVGGADSIMGLLGVGTPNIGDIAYIAGTSTAIVGVSDTWHPDPGHRYLGTPLAGTNSFGLEMDLLATGSAIRWLTGLLQRSNETELMQLAYSIPIEDAPPFLPYLAPGEQGALWDPRLRGAIAGLSLSTTPKHLARGLLTGILLESRRCIDTLAQAGLHGRILVAGGSSRDARFRADLADACGRTVIAPEEAATDYSAAGAARLAAAAINEPISIPPAASDLIHPRPQRAPIWAALGTQHDQIRTALTGAAIAQEFG